MSELLRQLDQAGLIKPPKHMINGTVYLTTMGSVAYGVSTDNSDIDLYGICIPKKNELFPHLDGDIIGFGRQKKRFEQYQKHHIDYGDSNYDITVYNIVKYFNLAMENNPNIVDSLFTPQNCVKHCTQIGQHIRENRTLFLHKGCWHKFKGYAYSQLHKMKSDKVTGNRKEIIAKYGYDIKKAYHVVRLMDEVEQILEHRDLDLQRAKEQLKSIRRGEWTYEDIKVYFNMKEVELGKLYHSSKLPHSPDEACIKNLLLECLEMHFGSLDKAIHVPDKYTKAVQSIKEICDSL